MSELRTFFDSFLPVNKNIEIEITSFVTNDFSYDIVVSNALFTRESESLLSNFFGGVPVKVERVEGGHNSIVKVARIKVPQESYSSMNILKYLELNHQRGWLIGIGNFGPQFLSLNKLTHAQVYGASGYGKSNFFKFLLSQTLAFSPNVINYIIDPKSIDFAAYARHPRVAKVSSDRNDWLSVMTALVIELNLRERLFSMAFTTPPTSLDEYNSFREDNKRVDLPELPRIILWIDESHQVFSDINCNNACDFCGFIAKKGRAFGIHLVVATQRHQDIQSSIRSQCTTSFIFYAQESSNFSIFTGTEPRNMQAIPGRVNYYIPNEDKFLALQVPLQSSNESLEIAFGFNSESRFDKMGLMKIDIPQIEMLDNGQIAHYLMSGKKIEEFRRSEMVNYLRARGSGEFEFTFADFYHAKQRSPEPIERDNEDILTYATSDKANSLEDFIKLIIPSYKVTDNTPEYSTLINGFHKRFSTSEIDFRWCTEDLANNTGLISVLKRHKGFLHGDGFETKFDDLALEDKSRYRLSMYLNDVKSAMERNTKAPLLILSGSGGLGKSTILQAISKYINLTVEKPTSNDLLLHKVHGASFDELLSPPKDKTPINKRIDEDQIIEKTYKNILALLISSMDNQH